MLRLSNADIYATATPTTEKQPNQQHKRQNKQPPRQLPKQQHKQQHKQPPKQLPKKT